MATAKTKAVRLNKNARAWVKALRSGKYKQTKNVLTRVDQKTGEITGHCCLGVACELAGVPQGVSFGAIVYEGENSILPESVQTWLGLKDRKGFIESTCRSLTGLNDDGKSFKQIARIIEQKAKELFV